MGMRLLKIQDGAHLMAGSAMMEYSGNVDVDNIAPAYMDMVPIKPDIGEKSPQPPSSPR